MNDTTVTTSPLGAPSSDYVAQSGPQSSYYPTLFFQQTDNTIVSQEMNGSNIAGSASLGIPTSAPKVVADFNGDGTRDIAFQAANGALTVWLTDGVNVTATGTLAGFGSAWSLVGTGDFNGDGKNDLLLHNTVTGVYETTNLAGTQVASGGGVIGDLSPNTLAGIGDMDGDGKADLLIQRANGTYAAVFMNDNQIVSTHDIGNPGGTWSFVALGDMNGDGKADMLFRDADGLYASWDLNGSTIAGGSLIGNPGSGWSFSELIDLNGDGKSDILFTDGSGHYAPWMLNDTQIIGTGLFDGPAGSHLIF